MALLQKIKSKKGNVIYFWCTRAKKNHVKNINNLLDELFIVCYVRGEHTRTFL